MPLFHPPNLRGHKQAHTAHNPGQASATNLEKGVETIRFNDRVTKHVAFAGKALWANGKGGKSPKKGRW